MHVLLRALGAAVLAMAVLSGCDDPFQSDQDDSPDYRVVRDNPTETIPLDDLLDDEGNDPEIYVRLSRSGYEVREYPVEYRGMDYDDVMIALKRPDTVTVGHGDSGSPIVDREGRVVAALYAGDATNKELFFARPIEDMTNELLTGAVAGSTFAGREPLISRHFVGIGSETLAEIRGSLGLPHQEWVTRPAPTSGVSGSAVAGSAPSVLAGQSILVRYLDGNIFRSYVSGTVTFAAGSLSEGGSILAFGHGVIGEGIASVPVDLVPVVGFVDSYRRPYKVVDPLLGDGGGGGGNRLGFLVKEAYSGAAVRQAPVYGPTQVESFFSPANPDLPEPVWHQVAATTRSTQDHYLQTMAILSPLIYEWRDAYNQDGDVTVNFQSFVADDGTTDGVELASDAGGVAGVRQQPLVFTYEDYVAGEQESSYLGYIVEGVYELVRETYRTQPTDRRFRTITVNVTLTDPATD